MTRRRFLQALAVAPALAVVRRANAQDKALSRRLRFTVRFANPLNRDVEGQHFWCYLPMNLAARQRLQNVEVSMPYRVLEDDIGHRILHLSFDSVSPMAQKIVTVTATVDLDVETIPQALPQTSTWLSAERFIESDDEQVQEVARTLRRESDTKTTQAIFEWVQKRISYAGYVADDLGARYALLHGRGDCTEYADLVVALARANGIPARMVGGYVTTQDVALRASDYHNWAEVYLDRTWHIVDAQKDAWLPPASQYVAYRIYRDTASNPVGTAHRYRLDGDLVVTF